MLHVSVTEVISMHENVINVYGGIHGIRDKGLLSSIVGGVFQTFGGNELYPTDKVWIKFVGYIICLLLIKSF